MSTILFQFHFLIKDQDVEESIEGEGDVDGDKMADLINIFANTSVYKIYQQGGNDSKTTQKNLR